ncbi:MAG TPA: hypothetical protein GXX35_13370 [Thermoanaerobacterales bacterium]|nr:hypothetical protein [Thermoanaerobacterales bacterium]
MELKENELFDRIIMGPPKTVEDITFIPILSVTLGCFKSFGTGFGGSISPKAFIVIDKDGNLSFYNLIPDENPLDIINNIS